MYQNLWNMIRNKLRTSKHGWMFFSCNRPHILLKNSSWLWLLDSTIFSLYFMTFFPQYAIYVYLCISICLSIYLSVCKSVCLAVCLSVCLSIYLILLTKLTCFRKFFILYISWSSTFLHSNLITYIVFQ